MEDTAQATMQALREAEVSLDKLTGGRAMPSLPIRDLLRVCHAQHAEIQELRQRIDDNRPDPRTAFIGG